MAKTTKKSKEQIVESKLTKRSYPLLEIRQKEGTESSIMVGANTQLLLDGKPLKGAQAVTFEVNARGIAKATVTLIGRFKVSGKVRTEKIKLYK